MATDAQKRAKKKWGSENVTHVQFDLYPADQELIDYMKERAAIEGKAAFFRRIIRNDMKGNQNMNTSYRLTAITAFGNVEWHDLEATDEAAAIDEGIAKFDAIQHMDVPRRGSEGYPHYGEARVVRVNKADNGNVSETNIHVIL